VAHLDSAIEDGAVQIQATADPTLLVPEDHDAGWPLGGASVNPRASVALEFGGACAILGAGVSLQRDASLCPYGAQKSLGKSLSNCGVVPDQCAAVGPGRL
ncbi:MAG TPA: hypothetical protein PKA88_28075, partial [Polyangiaceae bacterium]|nr:hypothetical protein [Polyangiaceae bacterium]